MRRSTTGLLPLAAAAALALGACAGGTDREIDPAVDTTPDGAGDGSPDLGQGVEGDGDGQGVGTPERPQRGQCVDLDEAEDGVYEVFDAGTATIVVRDSRLVLESVDPATGWEYEVDEEEESEIEIEFRREGDDGDELDLEVEIDDGRVLAQVCADDD